MPDEVVAAAVSEAHKLGLPVLAHPTDDAGLRAALRGPVDVLVHTTPETGGWDSSLAVALVGARIALVPTLKLWDWELARAGRDSATRARFQAAAVAELATFVRAGGRVLFGTDVGYMSDPDPAAEYAAMARAGMSADRILESLTTAPAAVFGGRRKIGRVEAGHAADLVVLEADPWTDPRAFAAIGWVVWGGRVAWVAGRLPRPAAQRDSGSAGSSGVADRLARARSRSARSRFASR
jgi:imidazolonepropionase-like amidohydrolase